MKTYVKILLIIAAALAVIGIVCFTVLAARGGLTDLDSLDNQKYTKLEAEYDILPDGEIIFDLDIAELNIVPSKDDKLHLTYYESERFKYDVEHGDDRLSVKFIDPPPFSFKWLFTIDFGDHGMTLEVPQGFAGSINIKTTTGGVGVKNLSGIDELVIRAATGDVELEAITADSIAVDVKTGDIEAEKINAESAIELSATTGDIELEIATAPSITTETSTGSQKLSGITSKLSRHSATTGSIVFEGIDSDNVTIEASTGSIRGTLVGGRMNYSVTSITSTGHSNVASDSHYVMGTRKLYIKTSTGDIKIEFRELIY